MGREGIEPTRVQSTLDLQSNPAPYGTTFPYNSNLTYLNLACTPLHFVNNSILYYEGLSITFSYPSNSRDNVKPVSPYREYLRIVPKLRLSTRPQLVLQLSKFARVSA